MVLRDLWIPIAALSVVGCGPSVDVEAEEEAIRSISAQWLEFARAEDAAGIASLFAADGTVQWEDRPVTSGRANIEELLSRQFAESDGSEETFSTDRIDMAASGDLAVEHGTWSNPAAQGRYMTLYRKLDGSWRAQFDMTIDAGPDGGAPDWATAALEAWYERYNARDAEALADLYTPTAIVGEAQGRAAIIQRFRNEWADSNETCSGGHDEFLVAGRVAVGAGRDVCTAPGSDGATTTTRYQWLAVHERQPDGTWLLVRDQGEEIEP